MHSENCNKLPDKEFIILDSMIFECKFEIFQVHVLMPDSILRHTRQFVTIKALQFYHFGQSIKDLPM